MHEIEKRKATKEKSIELLAKREKEKIKCHMKRNIERREKTV